MIVSWDWLSDYVDIEVPLDELTHQLTMSGLNLEGVSESNADTAIDLEVTSNRPDCLGHIGVAREISVLLGRELQVPPADPISVSAKTSSVCSVNIECPDLCPRYTARVIRGVQVGPSPQWLQDRLATLGVTTINNIVDITNYVLLECGQPLHAFDFDKLAGQRIVVRQAHNGEKMVAIDQRSYELSPEMCIIADAERSVALGGVMGGLDTEISDNTVNLLIEVANFAPISIRRTARKLNLHSPSSFRFERGIDPHQMDWASRRCCQLILELAGGELLEEPICTGELPAESRPAVCLRFAQIPRVLGIDIAADEAIRILRSLGLKQHGESADGSASFQPPSWRRDLTREIDLIEEVARIHGYDNIPEDVAVPLQLSKKTEHERVIDNVRDSLVGAGFFETVTLAFVNKRLFDLFTPRGALAMIQVDHTSRRDECILRQTLIPSLLAARRENERRGNFDVRLFEIASVFLECNPEQAQAEPKMLSFVSGQSFAEMKGIVATIARRLNRSCSVTVESSDNPQFVEGRGADVFLNGKFWGWIGELSRAISDQLELRDTVVVAELDLTLLECTAQLIPIYSEIPRFPAVARDLNFVLDESVNWQQLERIVRETAGALVDSVDYGGQYRGKQIPADKKSYVVTISYRSSERTLTNEEVEKTQQSVIAACEEQLGAALR